MPSVDRSAGVGKTTPLDASRPIGPHVADLTQQKYMPAKFVKSYQSPTGAVFPNLKDAQADELVSVLTAENTVALAEAPAMARFLVENSDKIVACLKQKERVNLRDAKPAKKRGRPTGTPAEAQKV